MAAAGFFHSLKTSRGGHQLGGARGLLKAAFRDQFASVLAGPHQRYTAGLQCLRRLWPNVHVAPNSEKPECGSAEGVRLEGVHGASPVFQRRVGFPEPRNMQRGGGAIWKQR